MDLTQAGPSGTTISTHTASDMKQADIDTDQECMACEDVGCEGRWAGYVGIRVRHVGCEQMWVRHVGTCGV